MTEPAVSVVVPTYNRAALLGRLIAALQAQKDVRPLELIVVDDASDDSTPAVLARLAAECPVPLRAVRLDENGGPAGARNAGWRWARAPLVAFIDDDCVPDPGWLSALTGAFGRADVVQGRTEPDPQQLEQRNAFSHTVLVEDEWGYYEACNIAYRRDLLEQLGGFDEGFRYATRRAGIGPIFGEDTDLAWRAKHTGARMTFAPAAVVFHDVRRQSYLDHVRDLVRREGVVRAMKRNPELRQLCRYGVFWRPAHAPALVAAVGFATVAASRHSRWRAVAGAVMCLPYVRYRTHTFPTGRPRNRPVVIPLALLSDLAEIGVLAAASVRYRTLVL